MQNCRIDHDSKDKKNDYVPLFAIISLDVGPYFGWVLLSAIP